MFKNILKIVILMIGIVFVSAKIYAYENGDFQIWNTDDEEVAIHKKVKFAMQQEFRFGGKASEFFYQHYDFGFVYGFDKMLDLGFFYRLVLEKSKRKWMEEDMPNVNATLKFDVWKFKLYDNNRLEYRHFRFKDDSVRYRNKFGLKLPLDFKKIKISPYVANEIHIVSTGVGYNENRLASGVEFDLTKYAKVDIYYMLRSSKITGTKWTNANVLGLKGKISF